MWGISKKMPCPKCGHAMLHSTNECDMCGHVLREHYECYDCGKESVISVET